MNSIPPKNVWGSNNYSLTPEEKTPDYSNDPDKELFIQQANAIGVLVHTTKCDKVLLSGESSGWLNTQAQKYLPKLLLKAWNNILYQIGYVTLIKGGAPLEFKISELRNKLLLSPQVIRQAASDNTVKETIDAQMNRLDQLRSNGRIDEPADVWADNVIKMFDIKNDGGNYTETFIRIHLIPEQTDYYKVLQYKIADLIPNEFNRPAIEVEISKPNSNPSYTCCVGGGVGPLSDAEIVTKAVEKIRAKNRDPWGNSRIVIYSAPSPMRGVNQLYNLPKLFHWWDRVQNFMTRWYNSHPNQATDYVLASNTAHVHVPKLKVLAGDHLQNMVETFAVGIKNHKEKSGSGAVVILGTAEAYKKKLYPEVFDKNDMNDYHTVEETEQEALQKIIDKTKSNILDPADLKKLEEIIRNHIEKQPKPGYLLLGCTELPLALHKMDGLMKELKEKGIIVIDTEEVIAQQIAMNVNRDTKANSMFTWLNEQST